MKSRVSDCNVHVKYTKRPSGEYEKVKTFGIWNKWLIFKLEIQSINPRLASMGTFCF